MGDRIHQPYRAPLIPGLEEILALTAPGLLGVALSGAGPTVFALATPAEMPPASANQKRTKRQVFIFTSNGAFSPIDADGGTKAVDRRERVFHGAIVP